MIKVDYRYCLSQDDLAKIQDKAYLAYDELTLKKGLGNDFLGWLDYPKHPNLEEIKRIKAASLKIQKTSQILVVVGIGGSYLGAKAVIEALSPYFPHPERLKIIFAGNTLSSSYMKELLDYLADKDFSVNVISKSGTTTEPAVAFRLLKELLIKKYGDAYVERIYATTDSSKGALRSEANELGYESFIVPDDIGGRYSWFTAVGLLPIAAAGIDIDALLKGSFDAMNDCLVKDFSKNQALIYGALRNVLYQKAKAIEILVSYEPKLSYISEWWKQLFGESEGKDHKGLFPASLVYSTDLHSMGQYVQEGQRIMFETVLKIKNAEHDLTLTKNVNDLDGVNYLDQKHLSFVNNSAMQGTILAHVEGGVPNIILEIDAIDEYNIGYLLYFMMFSCGITCYMQGINPFNQPGVESYKKNMFALLGKPGYEELRKKLQK